MDSKFWKGKRVLITGHTGFKGSWLCLWLKELGADITGYALDPPNELDHFNLAGLSKKITDIRGDIRDDNRLMQAFKDAMPDIVFHMAAQPLVRESYIHPKETYEINVIGTFNVLEAIRNTQSVRAAVIITTDKCYLNKEEKTPFKEDDPLGGYDPYSASKACAEIVTSSCRASFMNTQDAEKHGKTVAAIATARAGNVIGGGDWSKDRIIPDFIRAFENNERLTPRNPDAIRPWQHVLEALSGYMILAQKLTLEPEKYSQGWNFGPEPEAVATVKELVAMAEEEIKAAGAGKPSAGIARSKPDIGVQRQLYEAKHLLLDITKSKEKLGCKPVLTLKQCVQMTMDWYLRYKEEDVYELAREQIRAYTGLLETGGEKDGK